MSGSHMVSRSFSISSSFLIAFSEAVGAFFFIDGPMYMHSSEAIRGIDVDVNSFNFAEDDGSG